MANQDPTIHDFGVSRITQGAPPAPAEVTHYALYVLVSAVAIRLGRPLDVQTTVTYLGSANEYVLRDGGNASVRFRYGRDNTTGNTAVLGMFTAHEVDTNQSYTLAQAVDLLLLGPWQPLSPE